MKMWETLRTTSLQLIRRLWNKR